MKQLNVSQQNEKTRQTFLNVASYWRLHGLPKALVSVSMKYGIDFSRMIILHLDVDFPGMPNLSGTLLTNDLRFISFEIESDFLHEQVLIVDEWSDVSTLWNIGRHNPGFGCGEGALAIDVLHFLNKK